MRTWTDDQRALRSAVAPWCEAINDGHLDRDRQSAFDSDSWARLQKSGVLGLPFEPRWGGLGQDLVTTMYVLEGLGYGCRDGGLRFAATTHMVGTGVPLQRFGSERLKQRFMPAICDGALLGALAVSEPATGSDALSMRTTGRPAGDHWVLSGSKTFVSSGPIADLFVVYARTDADSGPLGITALLVEASAPGLTVSEPIDKSCPRTAPMVQLHLDDCMVPKANVLGPPGSGLLVLDHVMKWEILCSFIVNVGEMAHRIERCVEYAKVRKQFGVPIGAHQSVANRIVDMKVATDTARKWLFDTAERVQNSEDVTVDLAISKLLASEANRSTALAGGQMFGGNGYLTEFEPETDVRDAFGGTIHSGTSDIQRSRIAAMLGLPQMHPRWN